MKRMIWGLALGLLVAASGWSQSTWRGQAEIWPASDAPAEGFVAASNEFPKNSLLSVENYKTKKTVQVRVVSGLPPGSTSLVLLNAKAAQALEIKPGEIPLVGVRLDPTGVDRPDNPDPDVNPLAAKPAAALGTGAPTAVTPTTPIASVLAAPAPTLAPEAKDTTARTPAGSLDPARNASGPSADLLPLPAPTTPAAESRTPLAVAPDTDMGVPETPGRSVAVATPEPVVPTPNIGAPAEVPSTASLPAEVVPAPTEGPASTASAPVAPGAVAAVPVKPATAWVSVPGKLEGPVLGTVPLLAGLEKGQSYVQVGAWASEADVLAALGTVKSYVPLALYKAEGQKNPWRVVAAAVPKGQLGVVLMHFRSQGFRSAGVVKG